MVGAKGGKAAIRFSSESVLFYDQNPSRSPQGGLMSHRLRISAFRAMGASGVAVAVVVLAALPTGATSVQPRRSEHQPSAIQPARTSEVIVKAVKHGKFGEILATSSGYTLYHFTLDTAKALACNAGCIQAWPPLMLPKGVTHATAGKGVKQALLGTRKRGTALQVTYKGLPLYRYAADTGPFQTNGEGVGGTWFVVKAA
jgi:predicted lipoprotein with Yx(FWY)xxD motif